MRPFVRFAMTVVLVAFAGCGRGPQSKPSEGDALTLQGALANRFVRATVPGAVVARITLDAHAAVPRERPPTNIALVVDTSGSLEGRAIDDARAASIALVGELRPKDRLAVVVFNSKTEVLLPSTRLDDADLRDVRKRLGAMRAEGTTDMAAGLSAGIEEVAKNIDATGVNRVILLGDGVPNDESAILSIAQAAGARGISITALGLGPDYNESLMGAVAQRSGGGFHYIADSSKVAAFFKEEVVRLDRVYAKNAFIDISPGPGVTIDGVVGQETFNYGAGLRVNLGDISLGDRRELVVRLHATGRRDGAPVELLDAVLRFTEGIGGGQVERRVFLGAHATADDAKLASGRDAEVEQTVARIQAAANTLEEVKRARATDVPAPPRPTTQRNNQGGPPAAVAAEAPASLPPRSPESLKLSHDDAMRVIQGY